ncbi:hypothetical protein [Nocardioides baculatus]|uniref:Peptidase MA-like domain-containing protein n=1 Tax=Nocardioides baculatus TaxID=2801337 RepID=A0ABS1L6Q5_9ACTN|nr:hypothetical protein [Nocardioides baculatus]MBL0747212.1 hypothetical protein [Nocardioides baculatus]
MRTTRGMLASVLACVLLLPLAGCQSGADDTEPPPSRSQPPAGMDDSLRDAALALIDRREQALLDGDREAFLATISPDAEDFAATQARWWDNVAQLPATDFSLELGDEGVMSRVAGDGDLQLPVDFTMRLDGFDAEPVTQPLVYTFVGDEDEVHLASDRNIQSDAFTGWVPAPWDVTTIVVEQTDAVLGVFDEETAGGAGGVVASTEKALETVDALVPEWSGRAVVYTISDLDALDRMSLMDASRTAGVAFPVAARPGRRAVASYRMILNPESTLDPVDRLSLLRHELTHVALGELDDHSPEWLVEGSAMYVAGSSDPLADRKRRRARQLGDPAGAQLRNGRDFYQVRPVASYTLAGIVCDYLATTRGPDTLWDLMAAFRATRRADPDRILQRELGVDTEQLTADALAWTGAV